jgi:uncharacterized protein (DUF2235 family)
VNDIFSNVKAFHKTNCEPIDIIGFSRGAASGRIFANQIAARIPDAKIRFLGLFDTVAQFGVLNDFNFQYGYNLEVNVNSIGYTAHAVAADEDRGLFPLTSISKVYETTLLGTGKKYAPDAILDIIGPNYWERPFKGAHSDIGGGYQSGRNLEALKWMIERGQTAGAPFADLNKYPDHDRILNIDKAHDSRYWFLDRVPFTHWGRTKRTIFPGNN